MNESVLEAIEEHALTPDAVEHVVMLSEQRISVDQRKVLEEQRTDVEKRIQRVVAAIAGDDDVPAAALVAKLRELEARKVALSEELVALRAIPRLAPEVVSDRLNEWRRMLREEVTKARMVLDRVLAGRIVFTPIEDEALGRGYTFEA